MLWLLLIAELMILLLWAGGAWWVRSLRADDQMRIEPRPGDPVRGDVPRLAVFIAAHNEQERIGACLDRLRSQNYGNMRITVVNDRSDDTTGDQVRAVMARDHRVRLVEVDELPDGCIGKTHALAVAAADVEADYLLFMDCDCRLAPGAIAAVMHKVITEGLEFASLWPRLELRSLPERLLTPAISWVLGIWGLLSLKQGAANTEVKLGNGQFMVLSRNAYRLVGGHAAFEAELAEDLMIASKVAALGLKRWAGLGEGLYVTSRDNHLACTWNSLTRVVIGSLVQTWRVLLSTQLLLGGVVLPVWLLPLALLWAFEGAGAAAWLLAIACSLHLAAIVFVVRRLFAMTLEDSPSVASFILGSLIATGLLAWAGVVVSGRGYVRWGKTAYRVRGSRVLHALPAAAERTAA